MENNFASKRQFSEEQFNTNGASSVISIKENLKEFKHCILLHEKGLKMQDGSSSANSPANSRTLRTKKKASLLSVKTQSNIQHAEDFQEVNELRMNFKERHQ